MNQAELTFMPVHRPMRCIWCHWYRPRQGVRCWGFTKADVEFCIGRDYVVFKGRRRRKND